MQYSQIRAFHYVAICEGFSRAAEALSLTQPAISEQVRKLESEHDLLLFNRDRKQVTLTSAGRRLLRTTKQLFEVEQQIADVLSENRAVLDGNLRVMADSAFHLTNRLNQFRLKYPKVRVSIQTGNTADILASLRNYDVEIGVVGSLNPGSDMKIVNLGTSPIIAFASKDFFDKPISEISFQELASQPLVFREKGSKTRQKLEKESARQGVVLTPTFEVEGREAVQEIVAAGAGIGFVSEAELGQDQRLVKVSLKCPQLTMAESLIHLKHRSDVRLIRAFMRSNG